jgi:mRNA interferase MazF
VRRGSLVTVAARGHYSGKPRPALVIQANLFRDLSSVTICLLSSEIVAAPLLRLTVEPTAETGLKETRQIMIDKLVAVPRAKIRHVIGAIDEATMTEVSRRLMLFLGLVP